MDSSSSRVFVVALLLLVACPVSSRAQDENWIRMSSASADELQKTPVLTQKALVSTLKVFQGKWEAKPLMGTGGKPLPRKHKYIAPTIAWVQLQVDRSQVGLSLANSDCDGPNSSSAPDLYICKATLSTVGEKGDNYRTKLVFVCYTGQGGEAANEVAYNKAKNTLDYRVVIPDVNTDSCNNSFSLQQ